MRAHLLFLLAALLSVTALPAQERPRIEANVRAFVAIDDPVIALTQVRLVDGTGAPPRADQTIVIRGTRIEAVGPRATTPVPAGARTVDLSGHTVAPGLVSLHEHTYFGGLGHPLPMNVSGPLYLAHGVTTAMTAGSQLPYQELNLKRTIDAGRLAGPRLHIAGPYLTGGEPRPAVFRIVTPEEVKRVVAYWAEEGATWFKVLDGPTAVLRAVVEEAHSRGLRVTGHLCSVTFAEAAELGIDALQHGFITDGEHVPGKQPDVCPAENMRAQADVDVGSPAVQESRRRRRPRHPPHPPSRLRHARAGHQGGPS